jgi:NAD(P)-dependent dehydrogenase (short-subunit alcohol dehydrogenase family)
VTPPRRPASDQLFEDKTIVITGATSGIGAATAIAFAERGATVVVSGRNATEGERILDLVRRAGGRGIFVQVDLRERDAAEHLIGKAVDACGRVDFAFNNAGIFDRVNEFHTYEDGLWDEMINVNLSAVFRCMRAEISAMLLGAGGVIVNNASVVAHRGSERPDTSGGKRIRDTWHPCQRGFTRPNANGGCRTARGARTRSSPPCNDTTEPDR